MSAKMQLLADDELDLQVHRERMLCSRRLSRYAYGPELQLRMQLARVPFLYTLLREGAAARQRRMQAGLLAAALRASTGHLLGLVALVNECAATLGVPPPELFVWDGTASILVHGTRDASRLWVAARLVSELSPAELRFAVGCALGRLEHDHIILQAACRSAHARAGLVSQVIHGSVRVLLRSWAQGSAITADRAGLLCAGDLAAANRAAQWLWARAMRSQVEPPRDVPGHGYAEAEGVEDFAAQSVFWKRIQAMQLFAGSARYRRNVGLEGGAALIEVDAAVCRLLGAAVLPWRRSA